MKNKQKLESKDEKSKAIQFPLKNFESLHTEFQSLKARKQYTPFGTFLPKIIKYNSNRNHHAVRTSSKEAMAALPQNTVSVENLRRIRGKCRSLQAIISRRKFYTGTGFKKNRDNPGNTVADPALV
jgi:hypothetical protein